MARCGFQRLKTTWGPWGKKGCKKEHTQNHEGRHFSVFLLRPFWTGLWPVVDNQKSIQIWPHIFLNFRNIDSFFPLEQGNEGKTNPRCCVILAPWSSASRRSWNLVQSTHLGIENDPLHGKQAIILLAFLLHSTHSLARHEMTIGTFVSLINNPRPESSPKPKNVVKHYIKSANGCFSNVHPLQDAWSVSISHHLLSQEYFIAILLDKKQFCWLTFACTYDPKTFIKASSCGACLALRPSQWGPTAAQVAGEGGETSRHGVNLWCAVGRWTPCQPGNSPLAGRVVSDAT